MSGDPFDLSTSTGAMTLRRNLSLHTLASVSRLLATLDFEELLESIVSAAIELLGATRGFLFLIDDAGDLTMRVGRSDAGEAIAAGGAPDISMSLVRQALAERKCVYIRAGLNLPLREDSSLARLGIGAALCLPMTVTDLGAGRAKSLERRRKWMRTQDVIGVIYIDRPDPGKPLSAEDYALYAAMGNLAAAALVNAAVYQDAITDGLTGLAHRRHFEHTLAFETERARREHRPLSLLMLDLDFFKSVNDAHGHLVGDDILRKTGKLLKARTRPGDLVARYGGEEFAVILPDSVLPHALRIGEVLRAMIRDAGAEPGAVPMTVSIGAASLDPFLDTSQEDMVRRADEALYASKRAGRDRVTAWSVELKGTGVCADELRGIFSGDPSRDYRVVKLLMQVIQEFGAGGNPVSRLERTLECIREFVSARRIEVFSPGGALVARVAPAPAELARIAGTGEVPKLASKIEAGRWTRELRRESRDLGTLVVTAPETGKDPGACESAILDALQVQVALLVSELPFLEETSRPRGNEWQ